MEKFKNVGAPAHRCPNKGITLIALIITIIIMLILVAVTITTAINGGLFEKAGEAVGKTQNAINQEQQFINDIREEYFGNSTGGGNTGGETGGGTGDTVPTYANAAKDTKGYLTEKATYESDGYTAVIPKGFKVSDVTEEQAIGTGLVIKDANNNEFVWIPVTTDLESSYSYSSNYSEPTELTYTYSDSSAAYDSQATLDYLYGVNYYNYAEDFKYADEYAKMVEKVNANDGFYIGRYETTIDNGSIGSKYNTTVLTAGTKLFTKDSTNYLYRWYGLYYA